MTVIHFGIIGTSDIATKFKRSIDGVFKTNENNKNGVSAQITAVGSRKKERAEQWVQDHQLTDSNVTTYGSYDAVLNDDSVDAVYIPIPTTFRYEYCIKAAEAKKHILCEKPVALNTEQLEGIYAACRKHNVVFMDGVMWTHHKRTTLLKDQLKSIGSLRRINSSFSINIGQGEELNDINRNIRLHPNLDPLGATGDLGWYSIRGILFAHDFRLPKCVSATAEFNSSQVPFDVTATLWYSSSSSSNNNNKGTIASFDCQFDAAARQFIEFRGTEKTITVDNFVVPRESHHAPFVIYDHKRNAETIDVTNDIPQEQQMVQDFCDAINAIYLNEEGSNPNEKAKMESLVSSWKNETWTTQRVLDAIDKSLREEKAIEL